MEPVPSAPGQSSPHDITAGIATLLGNYTAEGVVRLDAFTSASTAAFSSEEPIVFVGENGDELVFHYGRTDFGAASQGEITLSPDPNDANQVIAVFVAEFNPVVGLSTGQFKDVIGGKFRMIAVSEPFVLGSKSPAVWYDWDGEGSLEFSNGNE